VHDHIVSLLSKLIRINSVNASLANGPGEQELAVFIENHLRELRLDPVVHFAVAGRPNVVVVVPGEKRERSLLINGHLDTVGVEGMQEPFVLKREGDRLYGRGAYDMKGGLCVMLMLARYFSRRPPPLDVVLAFVADEEDKSIGMEVLLQKWMPAFSSRPLGAIFLEPTEMEIGVAHKGFVWYELEIIGRAAHGSRPEEGVDAILPLRLALQELAAIQNELSRGRHDPLLGPATLHAGVVTGGTAVSVIPAHARLEWERRTLPDESAEKMNMEFERILNAVRNTTGEHRVSGRTMFARPGHQVAKDAQIVKCLREASPGSRLTGLPFWTDAALSSQAGIPSVLFGPAGHGAHAADEWVSLASLQKVYEALRRCIEAF
jgi:acetylornithine deacetylase